MPFLWHAFDKGAHTCTPRVTALHSVACLLCAGWANLENGTFKAAVSGLKIRHNLYRRERPFHPQRLATLLLEETEKDAKTKLGALGLVRSKGAFWLATRSGICAEWQQAGASCWFLFLLLCVCVCVCVCVCGSGHVGPAPLPLHQAGPLLCVHVALL